MHIDKKKNWVKHLDFNLIDIVTLVICYWFSYYLKFRSIRFWNIEIFKIVLLIEVVAFFVLATTTSIYSGVIRRGVFDEIKCSFILSVASIAIASICLYILKEGFNLSRQVFLVTFLFYIPISVCLKQLYKNLIRKGIIKAPGVKKSNLLVVSNKDIDSIVRNIKNSDHIGLYNVCSSAVVSKKGKYIIDNKIYNSDSLFDYICINNIDEVYFACNPSLIDEKLVKEIVNTNIGFHISINDIFNFYPENTDISKIGLYHTLGFGLYTFSNGQLQYLAFKRVMDVLFSIIGMIILLFLCVIFKIANLLNGDKGPLFYKQTRVGKNGKLFELYKFRSMYIDADDRLKILLKNKEIKKQWDEYHKLDNDPRVTKVGRILRKTSLDEFPQFINIFKGDMSLVGPRPLIPNELESLGGIRLYQQVRPGLTSWWAANGRSAINFEDRLDLEYYYVKHASLWLDIKCIIKTFFLIIRREGAE